MNYALIITANLLGRRVSVSNMGTMPAGTGEIVGLMLQPGASDPRALVLLDSGTLMTFQISSLKFLLAEKVSAVTCPACGKPTATKVDDSGRDPEIDTVAYRWTCTSCGHWWGDHDNVGT